MTAGAVIQFLSAIQAAGLTPPENIALDDLLHRFPGNGKRNDDSAWYVFHNNGVPAGAFGDWRSGKSETWRADIGRELTAKEKSEHKTVIAAARKLAEAENAKRQAEAAARALEIWKRAAPAPDDHHYFLNKKITANGARVYNGELVIPFFDGANLTSLQFIKATGEKRFLAGGRVSDCYFVIGQPVNVICICEGFATGATIAASTGYATVVAFSAGNLVSVAKTMRRQFPNQKIIMCADDDHRTDGNPGITKATEAARTIGGLIAIPDFHGERPEDFSDFNDMFRHFGGEAVEGAILKAKAPPDENHLGAPSSTAHAAEPDTFPSIEQRPCFRVFDDELGTETGKYRAGVWYFGMKQGKGEDPPTLIDRWISSPLHIDAVTFDAADNNFGRLLRFKNTLGLYREWAMPMDLLRAAGDELRGELLGMGVHIDPSSHRLLGQYIQALTPERRMHCATQVGWCRDSFVLPDVVIGPSASGVIFQSGERGQDEHTVGGTLEGWKTHIAARAVGNPMLLIAISASFAGPLLEKCHAESGGFHLTGESSTGKTTAIEAACATWGGPNYLRSWKATANGMEGAAVLFNDCLLALDELSECEPREIGLIVYALGNGRGKQRASRTGTARRVARWRCLVLSSGETTVETAMAAGGFKAKAGQSVRLLNIPSIGKHGAWDNLHGSSSGASFSEAIKQAAATHHGLVGRAFLENLTRDTRDFSALLDTTKALPEFAAEGGGGQDKRAAGRFALLAMAGELATEYGLTGWPQGAATEAAADGFNAWQAERGQGNDEPKRIVEAVNEFIEKHGDSRFSNSEAIDEIPVRDRAGWWKNNYDGRVYLFTASGLREALKGHDFKRALDVLQEAKVLAVPEKKGERAQFARIGGRAMKLYQIKIVSDIDKT